MDERWRHYNNYWDCRELISRNKHTEVVKKWFGGYIDECGNLYYLVNPNAKWDWYEIGGRWSGKLIVSGVGVDSARIKDIDWDEMRSNNIKQHKKWWKEFKDREKNGEHNFGDGRMKRFKDEDEYIRSGVNFKTFAVLKDDEWFECGSMGWFGCSSASKDEEKDWNDKYWDRFIRDEDPETFLTIVDCHI